MAAISVRGLTKDYGEVLANDEVSFEVAMGEVFGYLGPNGAGKTTTIRTLMGLQSPTEGTAELLGADVRDERALVEAKRRIGYLPAEPGFDEGATGREILDLHASIKGDDRREDLLSRFDPPLDMRVREYSSGNRKKLGLVQAFMHDPDLVILDEPTSGLDPLMQRRFEEFVREEADRGTTVFLSSHVLGEVRALCDRVGIIRDGEIVTVEGVEDLLDRSGKSVTARVDGDVAAEDVTLAGIHDLSVRSVELVAGREPRDDDGPPADGAGGTATDDESTAKSRPLADGNHGGRDVGTATELVFTYTGDVNELVDFLDGFQLYELDVAEAPLEDVFMRFYGDDDA